MSDSTGWAIDLNTTIDKVECDCLPFVETLNFYESDMDGKWVYDCGEDHYRLNISGSGAYYKMMLWDNAVNAYWDVYKVEESGESSDYLTYCEAGRDELAHCGGNWQIYDSEDRDWKYDEDATSLFHDCADDECDFSNFTTNDTDCEFCALLADAP